MEDERWLPVEQWPGYWVSDFGRFRKDEKIMRGSSVAGRYRMYTLRSPNASRRVLIHRLVLEVFVGPPPSDKHVACHFDDVPSNNRLDNLRWATQSENAFDKVRNGRHHQANMNECVNGHEFTPENTMIRRGSRNRWCRACGRARNRAWRRKPEVHAALMEKQRQRRALAREAP